MAIGVNVQWFQLLTEAIREAQAEGALDAREDAEQLAFDLNAYRPIRGAAEPHAHRARERGDNEATRGRRGSSGRLGLRAHS
jgi:hypothetical protein